MKSDRSKSGLFSRSGVLIVLLLVLLPLAACSPYKRVSPQQAARDVAGGRLDADGDGVPDRLDNCPRQANPGQADLNGDGWGDACDDIDGDGIPDAADAWPLDPENDFDADGYGADPFGNCGHVCTGCKKLAEICRRVDNCPYVANDQTDFDKDGIGDACDAAVGAEPPACHPVQNPCDQPPLDDSKATKDKDHDKVPDSEDNCLGLYNPYDVDTNGDGTPDAQLNTDNDAYGDPCDDDDDNDSIADTSDNCPLVANSTQDDRDCDGTGDICDTDRDGDGYSDADEISAAHGFLTSPTNADSDGDGTTDGPLAPACPPGLAAGPDPTPLGPAGPTIALLVRDSAGNDVKASWLPTPTGAAGAWQPDRVRITARFLKPDGTPDTFDTMEFEVINTTNFNGRAENDVEFFTTAPSNDVGFSAIDPAMGKVEVLGPNTEATVDFFAFDFGAQATVRMTALKSGTAAATAEIILPLDSDHDSLPDAWETAVGFDPTNAHAYGAGQLDGQADIDTSLDNSYTGDGLTNFQEYRGIIFDAKDAGGAITYTHQRLNPRHKDLFVRGDNFKNSITHNYTAPGVLDFTLDYAAVYGVPGGKNAFEEARIDVHDVTGMPSFSQAAEPPNIDILVVTNQTEKRADGLIATLNGLENGFINHPSALKPRYWTWDLKGASYIGTADDYAIFYDPATGVTKYGTETYHLCLMHYIYNRPYLEDTDNSSQCNQGYPGKLDPLDNVEDYYKENGTNPPDKKGNKKEDRCVVGNQKLDGDRMNPNWKTPKWGSAEYQAGVQYSAFDADADGRVENPVVTDADGLDAGRLDPGEYTAEQVQLHTVLHEMGHGVGMDASHTADPTCLMYQQSTDWSRAGHFSPAARSQILIHNQTE